MSEIDFTLYLSRSSSSGHSPQQHDTISGSRAVSYIVTDNHVSIISSSSTIPSVFRVTVPKFLKDMNGFYFGKIHYPQVMINGIYMYLQQVGNEYIPVMTPNDQTFGFQFLHPDLSWNSSIRIFSPQAISQTQDQVVSQTQSTFQDTEIFSTQTVSQPQDYGIRFFNYRPLITGGFLKCRLATHITFKPVTGDPQQLTYGILQCKDNFPSTICGDQSYQQYTGPQAYNIRYQRDTNRYAMVGMIYGDKVQTRFIDPMDVSIDQGSHTLNYPLIWFYLENQNIKIGIPLYIALIDGTKRYLMNGTKKTDTNGEYVEYDLVTTPNENVVMFQGTPMQPIFEPCYYVYRYDNFPNLVSPSNQDFSIVSFTFIPAHGCNQTLSDPQFNQNIVSDQFSQMSVSNPNTVSSQFNPNTVSSQNTVSPQFNQNIGTTQFDQMSISNQNTVSGQFDQMSVSGQNTVSGQFDQMSVSGQNIVSSQNIGTTQFNQNITTQLQDTVFQQFANPTTVYTTQFNQNTGQSTIDPALAIAALPRMTPGFPPTQNVNRVIVDTPTTPRTTRPFVSPTPPITQTSTPVWEKWWFWLLIVIGIIILLIVVYFLIKRYA